MEGQRSYLGRSRLAPERATCVVHGTQARSEKSAEVVVATAKPKGSPGIDGMTVDELPAHLAKHWSQLREDLLAGRYQPQPVRRHAIPKKDGGVRELGIPTVLDRLIQQCMLQVLQPQFDPSFSQHSYGFRPGKSAHDGVRAARRFIQEGRRWVVDVDLEAFFDRVNHDVLMGRLAKRIADRRLLRLIRHYLDAGIMANGVVVVRYEGTPQGGPLSPLLANVLLDEVDKELERRGQAFARYADDCNVYVRSKRAGERVMEALRRLFTKLRLRVNESKSAVARPQDRKFLGYSFWYAKGSEVKRRVARQALVAATSTTSVFRGSLLPQLAEPPGADPHARWCGRERPGESPTVPTRLHARFGASDRLAARRGHRP